MHGVRWYDPATQRRLTQDPIGFLGGQTNLSEYCGNAPTDETDPSGLGASQDKNGTWHWDFWTTQQEKCDICKATHDAYKKAGDKAKGGNIERDCSKLKAILAALDAEIAGRQKYLDLNCDKFNWSDNPPNKSPKEMEEGRRKQLEDKKRYRDKVNDRINDPNGPCGCKK